MMMDKKYKYSLMAPCRWEENYIVEWLNYYREIGFDHVYLYCNDEDPTSFYRTILPFVRSSFVTFFYCPIKNTVPHIYAHFLNSYKEESEWIAFFDVDEYLRLPEGMSIGEFLRTFDSNPDCILFNWVFFGPNGHKTPGKSILEEYFKREDRIHPLTKFIIKSDKISVDDFHVHWPFSHKKLNVVNVLGEDARDYPDDFEKGKPEMFVNDPVRKEKILSHCFIHHYAFRTEQAFLDRVRRGISGSERGQIIWRNAYNSPDFNQFLDNLHRVEDRGLCDFWTKVAQKAFSTSIIKNKNMPVSLFKKATQSSICERSIGKTPEEDAMGGVDGYLGSIFDISTTNFYILGGSECRFRTDVEDSPWWMVDLEKIYTIEEIRIYNGRGGEKLHLGALRLAIETSLDGEKFISVYQRARPFGGVLDGKPMVWQPDAPLVARFVRIRLLGRDYLRLDQVEVYGTEAPPLPEDFDPDGYLALNEDVRTAGVDPVQHWLEHGHREGRRWR